MPAANYAAAWRDAWWCARHLGTSESHFLNLVKAGKFPTPNEVRKWSVDELDAAMLSCVQEAVIKPEEKRYPRGAAKALVHDYLSEEDIIKASKPWAIQRESGVYFLVKDNSVVYVGQSVNVIARIMDHTLEKQFDSWHWAPCPPEMLDYLERHYIDKFLPPLNRDSVTLGKRKKRSNRRG